MTLMFAIACVLLICCASFSLGERSKRKNHYHEWAVEIENTGSNDLSEIAKRIARKHDLEFVRSVSFADNSSDYNYCYQTYYCISYAVAGVRGAYAWILSFPSTQEKFTPRQWSDESIAKKPRGIKLWNYCWYILMRLWEVCCLVYDTVGYSFSCVELVREACTSNNWWNNNIREFPRNI